MTYISWSSDFVLYLQDYLMHECHISDNETVWPKLWPQSKYKSIWPIFHGLVILLNTDLLSGTKIAGQLRKNTSGHATRIFAKKSRKFEIPAVRLKGFLQSCTCVSLTCIKNINIISLGTWFLYRVYPITKPSVAEILHSLFTYTPVRDDPNDNRCTYNIDN